MQESTKTKAFVGGAALMVVASLVSHFVSQPRSADDFAEVGKPFFENFNSSSQAKSLEVVAVDPDTVQRNRFKVAKVDGLWRIPSHDNYPAEASDRLATTASSIIGIERESLAGRGKNDYERLGVVDPLSEEIDDPEAVGQRLTLKDDNDEALADYIIGNQVEDVALSALDRSFESGQNRQTYFYVRRADEPQTYIVPLKLELSTKFSDWIDPDLLRFDTSDLSQVTVRNYSLTEQVSGNPLVPQRALVKKDGDILALAKSDSKEWTLAGVEPDEEFDSTGVTEMINMLGELRIEDVRRKLTFQGKQLLTADLKVNEDPELMKSREQFGQAISQLVAELEDKGFNLAGSQQQLELVSDQGEIEFGTTEGMKYTLYIGAPFEEGAAEIKVAGTVESEDGDETDNADSDEGKDSPEENEGEVGEATAGSDDGPKSEGADENENDDDARSRYMLVRVALDQSLLTGQPKQPTKPESPKKPEGYTLPVAPEDDVDAAADETDKGEDDDVESGEEKSDEAAEDTGDDEPAGNGADEAESDSEDADEASEETDARPPAFEAYDTAKEQYEQAVVDYELALTRFTDDQKRFKERVETAKKLESELNERFSDWYYVISGENLKALQLSRSDLVSTKEPPAAPKGKAPAALPDRPNISFDGGPDETVEDINANEDSSDGSGEEEAVDPSETEAGADAVDVPETGTEKVDGDEPKGADVTDSETEAPVAKPVPKPPTTPPPSAPATPPPAVEPAVEPNP